MRYLNEHARAGHTVSIPSVLSALLLSPGKLMAIKKKRNERSGCQDRETRS